MTKGLRPLLPREAVDDHHREEQGDRKRYYRSSDSSLLSFQEPPVGSVPTARERRRRRHAGILGGMSATAPDVFATIQRQSCRRSQGQHPLFPVLESIVKQKSVPLRFAPAWLQNFGGGFIPSLSPNTQPAPECQLNPPVIQHFVPEAAAVMTGFNGVPHAQSDPDPPGVQEPLVISKSSL